MAPPISCWSSCRRPRPPNFLPPLPEVRQRIAEIVFHSSLVAEMQAIQAIRELTTASGPVELRAVAGVASGRAATRQGQPDGQHRDAKRRGGTMQGCRRRQILSVEARFHRVGPPPDDLLGAGSSGDRSPRNLTALWDAGRSSARGFLIRDGRQIGSCGKRWTSRKPSSTSIRRVSAGPPPTTPTALLPAGLNRRRSPEPVGWPRRGPSAMAARKGCALP